MLSGPLAGAAPAMLRRRRQQHRADDADQRLTRAEDSLEQARRARQDEQRKTRRAARVNHALDEIAERNDVSSLIADIFGFGAGES